MHSENIKQYNLQSLIDDLNYATLIEERWIIEFVDAKGMQRIMGNGHKRMKDGIWVAHLDRDKGEFPRIRMELENAKSIFSVSIQSKFSGFDCIDK